VYVFLSRENGPLDCAGIPLLGNADPVETFAVPYNFRGSRHLRGLSLAHMYSYFVSTKSRLNVRHYFGKQLVAQRSSLPDCRCLFSWCVVNTSSRIPNSGGVFSPQSVLPSGCRKSLEQIPAVGRHSLPCCVNHHAASLLVVRLMPQGRNPPSALPCITAVTLD
jgi:hypothetical protein